MTESYVQLPSDATNVGKKVRTNQRTVGLNDVHEHYMVLQDVQNDLQAQVVSSNVNTATGLAVWALQAGSYNVYGVGSENYIKGGSVEVYNRVAGSIVDMPIVGVSGTYFQNILGSVQVNAGSVRADSVQITNPWIVSGTATVAGSVYTTGSMVVSSASTLGISGNIVGSVVFATGHVGSVVISGTSIPTWRGIGSVTGDVGVSGATLRNLLGSFYFAGGVGSVVLSGTSVVSISGGTSLAAIGSWTGCAGSIWSMPAINVSVGSEFYIKGGSLEGVSQIAGSIWSMPAVSVTAGSQMWLRGGSLEGTSQIAGSIWSMPSVSVTAGSEQWIKGGSIQTYTPLGVGSVMISGTLPLWLGVGSVEITNPKTIGSYTGMSNGSIWFGGGVGSVMLSGCSQVCGSVVFATGHVGSIVISGTSIPPWRGIGSVLLTQTGSVMISGTLPLWLGVGSVHIGTGIGSVYIAGINSDNLVNTNVGSPCFKTSYLIASGAWSQTWTIGGAGSRLEIHGWHISTNLPGWVRILVSGTSNNAYDSGLIANYFLNFASGGVIEKTFVSPIIPAGAGSAIGFGTTSAGSTNVTIYGREVK